MSDALGAAVKRIADRFFRGAVNVNVPTLLITGPVGVGKTAVATEAGHLLGDAGFPHAVVDLDQLAEYRPRAVDDRFGTRIGLANREAVWKNYAAAGAQRLIIASVIESRAELGGPIESVVRRVACRPVPKGLIDMVRRWVREVREEEAVALSAVELRLGDGSGQRAGVPATT